MSYQPAIEPTCAETSGPIDLLIEPHRGLRRKGTLTLPEKVGQLIMPWVIGDFAPVGSASHERVLEYLEKDAIGGLIMSVGSPTSRPRSRRLNS